MFTSRLPIMDQKLICQWLGLSEVSWPADHYTMLGLPPGEGDPERIEQHVQERLARLRCYQLSHPEEATTAMNCLAKAFVCLTDPGTKTAYDASLGLCDNGRAAPPRPPAARPAVRQFTGGSIRPNRGPAVTVADPTPAPAPPGKGYVLLDWNSAPPPPVRLAAPPEPPPAAPAVEHARPEPPPPEPSPPVPAPAAVSPPLPEAVVSRPADRTIDAARASWVARRGLGTRRALYDRVLATRELLRLWDQAGKYLGRPKRTLVRAAEGVELTKRLTAIDDALVDFPRLLGQPGQPGYRVVILARDDNVAISFRKLGPLEREALALDWKIGRNVLQTHLRFVRDEVRRVRRQGWKATFRPVSFFLDEYLLWVTVSLAVLVLGIALFLVL